MSCERDLAFTWIVVLKKKSKIEPKGSSVIESVRCESVTCEPIRQANHPSQLSTSTASDSLRIWCIGLGPFLLFVGSSVLVRFGVYVLARLWDPRASLGCS